MYAVEIWMKGNEFEEDERDFQIKTSEVLPKVSSRPWVGGGAIDYCPCYGQIAFYSLITFSYQPQQGLHTQATNTLSHKHTVKSLGNSYRHSKTEEVIVYIWFPGSVKSIVRRLGSTYFQHISIFFYGNMYIVSNKESIPSIRKGATVLLLPRKGCAKAWSPAWHCGQIYRVLFIPPPLKTFKQKSW